MDNVFEEWWKYSYLETAHDCVFTTKSAEKIMSLQHRVNRIERILRQTLELQTNPKPLSIALTPSVWAQAVAEGRSIDRSFNADSATLRIIETVIAMDETIPYYAETPRDGGPSIS